jgi:hypothetical protein
MTVAVSPVLAMRSAVVAAAGQTVVAANVPWYTTVAPEGAGGAYAVWASAADAPSASPVFRRGSADVIDEFAVYADATDALAATEVAYAIFAAIKDRLDNRRVPLGADPNGRPLLTVRCRVTLLALLDEPDVANRAHAACRVDATVWSA